MDIKQRLVNGHGSKYVKAVDCSNIFGDKTDIFYVASVPVEDFEQYQAQALRNMTNKEIKGLKAMLLAMTLCDEEGTFLFDWKKKEDVVQCKKIPTALATRLYEEAQKFNLGSNETMEERIKNSVSGPTEDFS